jgi:hypothetical protein
VQLSFYANPLSFFLSFFLSPRTYNLLPSRKLPIFTILFFFFIILPIDVYIFFAHI